MFTFRAPASVLWKAISQPVTSVFRNISVTFLSRQVLNPHNQQQLLNYQLILKIFMVISDLEAEQSYIQVPKQHRKQL